MVFKNINRAQWLAAALALMPGVPALTGPAIKTPVCDSEYRMEHGYLVVERIAKAFTLRAALGVLKNFETDALKST